jgi:4-hydroxy-tetrahydrodipicolinate synthase
LNDELLTIYDLLFAENNPAGVKGILAAVGMIENHLRLPLVPLSDQLYGSIRGLLDQMKS